MSVIELQFSKCCECGARATKKLEFVEHEMISGEVTPLGPTIIKHYCSLHFPKPLDRDELALLLDDRDAEIAKLREACRIALLHAPTIRLAPERRYTIKVLTEALNSHS